MTRILQRQEAKIHMEKDKIVWKNSNHDDMVKNLRT